MEDRIDLPLIGGVDESSGEISQDAAVGDDDQHGDEIEGGTRECVVGQEAPDQDERRDNEPNLEEKARLVGLAAEDGNEVVAAFVIHHAGSFGQFSRICSQGAPKLLGLYAAGDQEDGNGNCKTLANAVGSRLRFGS